MDNWWVTGWAQSVKSPTWSTDLVSPFYLSHHWVSEDTWVIRVSGDTRESSLSEWRHTRVTKWVLNCMAVCRRMDDRGHDSFGWLVVYRCSSAWFGWLVGCLFGWLVGDGDILNTIGNTHVATETIFLCKRYTCDGNYCLKGLHFF